MKRQFIIIGLLFVLIGVALRAGSYVMQFAPTEASGFGLTVPLDAGVALFGSLLCFLGLDPDLIVSRAKTYFTAYAEIKRERRERRRGTDHV